MERVVFDNQKFISLVKPNSCLWDTSHKNYSNKNKKQQCWVEISKQMKINFDELTSAQQNEYRYDLQRKWKSLRNSFARELAKRRKSKSGTTWKTYVFFEQLSFLIGCSSNKNCEKSTCIDTQKTQVVVKDDGTSTPVRKKMKLSSNKYDLLKERINRHNMNQNQLEQDDDRHFLLSLVGDFKRVPIERRMDVKLAIIDAIRTGTLHTESAVKLHTPTHHSSSLTKQPQNSTSISPPYNNYVLQFNPPNFKPDVSPASSATSTDVSIIDLSEQDSDDS